MEKIENLLSKYESEFSEKGLSYSVSKKYFENKTLSTSFRYHDIFDIFLRHIILKREKNNFHYQRNRFHSAVICFYPSDKGLLKRTECKEYAFILYEISRYEEGLAPKERRQKEEKILKKVEKKVKSILNSAKKKNILDVCRETKLDIIRYFFMRAYGYKKTIVGINRDSIDLVLNIFIFSLFWIVALYLAFVI